MHFYISATMISNYYIIANFNWDVSHNVEHFRITILVKMCITIEITIYNAKMRRTRQRGGVNEKNR